MEKILHNKKYFPDWLKSTYYQRLPILNFFFIGKNFKKTLISGLWWQGIRIFLKILCTLFWIFSSHWRIEEVSILRNSFWHLYALLIFCTTMNIFFVANLPKFLHRPIMQPMHSLQIKDLCLMEWSSETIFEFNPWFFFVSTS